MSGRLMFARGENAAEVYHDKSSINTFNKYCSRRGTIDQENKGMTPLNACFKANGRHLKTKKQLEFGYRHRGAIQRLNSAPELYRAELPPIQQTVKVVEKPSRPLTPVVVNCGRNPLISSRSLPTNYRINLDLTPLVEVGTNGTHVPLESLRQSSLGSDMAQSSDSYLSSGSTRLRSLSSSSRTELGIIGRASPRSATSHESMEETEGEDESGLEEVGKNKMILRWLQTIEKNSDTITGELLPSITEGRPS